MNHIVIHATQKVENEEKKLKFMRNGNIKKIYLCCTSKKAITNKSFELLTLYFVVSSVQCLCLSMLSLHCTHLVALFILLTLLLCIESPLIYSTTACGLL